MKNLVLDTIGDNFYKPGSKNFETTKNGYLDTMSHINSSFYSREGSVTSKIKDLKINFLMKGSSSIDTPISRNEKNISYNTNTSNYGKNFLSKNLEINLNVNKTLKININNISVLSKINSPSISVNSRTKLKELLNLNNNFSKSKKPNKILNNYRNLEIITKTTPKKDVIISNRSKINYF